MKNETKKLSLSDFKQKVNNNNSAEHLNMISGGILGSCHCVTVCYGPYTSGSSTYTECFYNCN
jgi:hypothetical protein